MSATKLMSRRFTRDRHEHSKACLHFFKILGLKLNLKIFGIGNEFENFWNRDLNFKIKTHLKADDKKSICVCGAILKQFSTGCQIGRCKRHEKFLENLSRT